MMMEVLQQVPYILRIIITLCSILLIMRISKNLIFSISIGIIILSVWSGHSFPVILQISWHRFSNLNNLFLITIVFQVIWLSSQMKESGVMKDLVEFIKNKSSQKTAMAVLPAIIGLLPMPGGAIFSAPMVDDCDPKNEIDNHWKTKINYWFRHIWEYWWPLYPGVLLAIEITGLQVWQFTLFHFPLSLFTVGAGILFLLSHIPVNQTQHKTNEQSQSYLVFIRLVSPIIIIITVYLLMRIFFPQIFSINKYLPMMSGILIAQIYLQLQRPIPFSEWKKLLISMKTLKLVIVVSLVRIYGAFIEAQLPDGTYLMTHVREELMLWNIPLIAVIMLIPFISGLTTGLAVGFVGASFPIVINLLGPNPELNQLLSYTVLAYATGYIGMILSPVHICLLVTNEYFKTNLIQNIVQLFKPASIVIIGALILHFLARLI